MNTTEDGGPAFSGFEGTWPGMSLRDYFAAKAMQALLMHVMNGGDEHVLAVSHRIPQGAYEVADAMIQARNKR